jgi:hypothetical protein
LQSHERLANIVIKKAIFGMFEMTNSYSAPVHKFLLERHDLLVNQLSAIDSRQFRNNEPSQIRAWERSLEVIQQALQGWDAAQDWQLILEYSMRRLGRRIDALLISPRGIMVLEFKVGATSFATNDRRQVEDYGLDLQDFHAASHDAPIVPILVATDANPKSQAIPLCLTGCLSTVLEASGNSLGALLRDLLLRLPKPKAEIDVANWEFSPYRPVPGIIDAACSLYGQHNVTEITSARADAINLSATTDTVLAAIDEAKQTQTHIALFITGIPGAGKTLCGLNVAFGAGRDTGSVFLTGNPTLVHVLREALARDVAGGDRNTLRAARQRMKSLIQALPAFRDENVPKVDAPHEHVAIIDEAQRSWEHAHALRKSRDRPVRLLDSEPALLLDIMGRHRDWAVLVCLIGSGQEIHDGEGGLAEWGKALAQRPDWRVMAAPDTLAATEPRRRLPNLPGLRMLPELHLAIPVRNIRNNAGAAWVEAVLQSDEPGARGFGAVPFYITRNLTDLRNWLWTEARGHRRSGLVASSGAKRLRADGLGVEVPHMDEKAVASWFLDRWPEDVRASDALEQVATEFTCQGLELDHVGLCWGGDLIRQQGWRARRFSGTAWQTLARPDAMENRLNTYRVLLTRARCHRHLGSRRR